jgi:hypothetical protein
MNPIIKAVIGEADLHSPTERAVLDREATSITTEPHGEANAGNPEESKEVQLGNQILAAIKSGDTNGAIRAANELIQMHGQQPGAEHPGMGGHVQPVPHPQPPRALDYGPSSGGIGREA